MSVAVDPDLKGLLDQFGDYLKVNTGLARDVTNGETETYRTYYISGRWGLSSREVTFVHWLERDVWEGDVVSFGEWRDLDEDDVAYFKNWIYEHGYEARPKEEQ